MERLIFILLFAFTFSCHAKDCLSPKSLSEEVIKVFRGLNIKGNKISSLEAVADAIGVQKEVVLMVHAGPQYQRDYERESAYNLANTFIGKGTGKCYIYMFYDEDSELEEEIKDYKTTEKISIIPVKNGKDITYTEALRFTEKAAANHNESTFLILQLFVQGRKTVTLNGVNAGIHIVKRNDLKNKIFHIGFLESLPPEEIANARKKLLYLPLLLFDSQIYTRVFRKSLMQQLLLSDIGRKVRSISYKIDSLFRRSG